MATARAMQFVQPRQAQMVEVDLASPGPGQVAVRMLASSLCNHPELRSFYGGQPGGYGSSYPMAPGEPGHEGVGEVTDVGEGVTELAVGDIVVMTGHGGEATHRSHLLRKAETLARIQPDGRDAKAASILEMFGCAYHCIRAGWKEPGGYDNARVAVIGAGAIGLCSVQILRLWPAREVNVLDVYASKLELAAHLGATATVPVPPGAEPQKLGAELGVFDIVVKCSGYAPRGIAWPAPWPGGSSSTLVSVPIHTRSIKGGGSLDTRPSTTLASYPPRS
ncbi:MAG: alcohol dehydrogenase catalytic domain-containing protein [Planctomycetes bacterium]|nr:alcohol dehydrogenase catalytic domain-containing protein [Planctomycetota bacterium]